MGLGEAVEAGAAATARGGGAVGWAAACGAAGWGEAGGKEAGSGDVNSRADTPDEHKSHPPRPVTSPSYR